MEVFEIDFLYYGANWKAEVTKVDNQYRVSPEDDRLAEMYGEYVFTYTGSKFIYNQKTPEHLQYLIAVSSALQGYV